MKWNSAITIGAFDGVHRGHQKLIRKCVKIAAQKGNKSIIIVFERPVKNIEKVLSLPSEKIEKIKTLGADKIIVIKVPSPVLNKSADEFLKEVLIGKYKVADFICGKNFAFGKDRQGKISWLSKKLKENAVKLHIIAPSKNSSKTISSSLIRNIISAGKVEKASSLLGDAYFLRGKHFREKNLAASLGFPTVNLKTDERKLLPAGVFISLLKQKEKYLPSITNIGHRPTIEADSDKALSVEVHILNFKGIWNIKNNEVKLIKKIRDERKFNSLEDLRKQVRKDILKAERHFFNSTIKNYEL